MKGDGLPLGFIPTAVSNCTCAGSLQCISEDAGHRFKAGQLPSLSATPAGTAGAQQLAGSSLGCNGQSLLGALPRVGGAQRHLLIPVSHPRKQKLVSLLTPELALIPGTSEFGFLATNRVVQARKG